MRKQIASIPALINDLVRKRFDTAGRATEANLEIVVISVICAVGDRSFAVAARSFAFQYAVEETVNQFVS